MSPKKVDASHDASKSEDHWKQGNDMCDRVESRNH